MGPGGRFHHGARTDGRGTGSPAVPARADGKSHQAIYNVAWSDQATRKEVDGKLPAVGNTIDLSTATYTNSIGALELIGTFTDPSINPTPRWTAYGAVRYKVKMSPDVTMTVVERAVTSPIWYRPN